MHYDVSQISQTVSSMTKVYPDFVKVFIYKDPYQKQIEGFEPSVKVRVSKSAPPSGSDEGALVRSVRRTRTTISDIVLCNNFDIFATFTFSQDRQNISILKTRMQNWLQSQKKLHPSLKYIIVPEHHKDKKSIHFHALMSGYNGSLIPSCKDTPYAPIVIPYRRKKLNYCNLKHEHKIIKTKKGSQLFNIKSYTSGYSTAAKIDNINKVSNYIRKYIQKDMTTFPGKNRYWCSKELKRPYVTYNERMYIDNPYLKKQVKYDTPTLSIIEIRDIVTPLNNKKGISWQNSKNENQTRQWYESLSQNSSWASQIRASGMPLEQKSLKGIMASTSSSTGQKLPSSNRTRKKRLVGSH